MKFALLAQKASLPQYEAEKLVYMWACASGKKLKKHLSLGRVL